MSLNLARELWGQPGQLVPVVFTVNRLATTLVPEALNEMMIAGVEVSAVLLRQKGWLGGVAVFTGISADKKIDVTAREAEQTPCDIFGLATDALSRAIGLRHAFELTALDPYLRVESALDTDNRVYRCGTIVFPHAAMSVGAAPDIVSLDLKTLSGSGSYEKVAPTFVHEAVGAAKALGLKA